MQLNTIDVATQSAVHFSVFITEKTLTKTVKVLLKLSFFAEREGFEPPEALTSTVFKTAAIDHSAISPELVLLTRLSTAQQLLFPFCECKVRHFF